MAVKLGVSDQNRYTPYDMPCLQVQYQNLKVYVGTNSWDMTQTNPWDSAMGYHGSYVAGLSGNDTWTTTVDITGSGHLAYVMGSVPPWNTNSTVHTMRITIDGVEYERAITMSHANMRMFLGTGLIQDTQLGSGTFTVGRFKAYGTSTWTSHGYTSATYKKQLTTWNAHYMMPPYMIMAEGLPTVPFRESLKVEQKNSSGSYNSNQYKNHYAAYHITG